jgi:hypothetical protein
MASRHGRLFEFTDEKVPGFGLIARPVVEVHLRAAAGHDWSPKIKAVVDTGASITLINEAYLGQIAGLERNALGSPLRWRSATGIASCQGAVLDLLLGPKSNEDSLLLVQRRIYITNQDLTAPILLGQLGILDHVHLIHSNCGHRRGFRFTHPR